MIHRQVILSQVGRLHCCLNVDVVSYPASLQQRAQRSVTRIYVILFRVEETLNCLNSEWFIVTVHNVSKNIKYIAAAFRQSAFSEAVYFKAKRVSPVS